MKKPSWECRFPVVNGCREEDMKGNEGPNLLRPALRSVELPWSQLPSDWLRTAESGELKDRGGAPLLALYICVQICNEALVRNG